MVNILETGQYAVHPRAFAGRKHRHLIAHFDSTRGLAVGSQELARDLHALV